MKKIIFLITIFIILFLVLFFYPKVSVRQDDSFTAISKDSFVNKQCSCFGFEKIKLASRSETFVKYCYGIPYNCSYECYKKLENKTFIKVNCE